MTAVSFSATKAFLNVETDTQDDELVDTIDRAEAIIARRIGGPLVPTIQVETHSGPGPLLLRRRPVLSVTSVTVGGVAATGYTLNEASGLLYGGYGVFGWLPRDVVVTYVAGWGTPLPPDLEAAVLELTKHLWESQRVSRPGARPGFGGGPDFNPEVETGARYLLPYRVQTLLEPFLSTSSIA